MTHNPVPLSENPEFLAYVEEISTAPAAPPDRRQAIGQMRQLRALETEIAQVHDAADAEMQIIAAWRDAQLSKLNERAHELRTALGNWWTAVSDADPTLGRTVELPHGKIARRVGSLIVEVEDETAAVEFFESADLDALINRPEPKVPDPTVRKADVKKAVADRTLVVRGGKTDDPGSYQLFVRETGAILPGVTMTRNPEQITIETE